MKKQHKKGYLLASVLLTLILCSVLSGVLASEQVLTVKDNTPSKDILVNIAPAAHTAASSELRADDRQVSSTLTEPQEAPPQTDDADAAPAEPQKELHADLSVYDDWQEWSTWTEIPLFFAVYENDAGVVTVESADGESVVAPGTQNSYDFNIKNVGEAPIYYVVKTTAKLTTVVGGVSYTIPMDARFYNTDGEYLVGSPTSYEDMRRLDGLRDPGSLSPGCLTRYTLDWMWPFEGDDVYDTLLGNLAATGERLDVTVIIEVIACTDEDATGGTPYTGDDNHIGLWIGLCVCSLVGVILLLATTRRKEQDEEA